MFFTSSFPLESVFSKQNGSREGRNSLLISHTRLLEVMKSLVTCKPKSLHVTSVKWSRSAIVSLLSLSLQVHAFPFLILTAPSSRSSSGTDGIGAVWHQQPPQVLGPAHQSDAAQNQQDQQGEGGRGRRMMRSSPDDAKSSSGAIPISMSSDFHFPSCLCPMQKNTKNRKPFILCSPSVSASLSMHTCVHNE